MPVRARMQSGSGMKFLLVGFDGLRPEMISAQLMPNLFQFADGGVRFENHRCAFPSETYVNLPSLVTGTMPRRHGIIANSYLDPAVDPRVAFDGSSIERIEQAQTAYRGALFGAPSMGEILADSSRRLAVISTNSPGSVRLKHHHLANNQHLCLSCHTPETSHPPDEVADIVARLGSPAEKVFPDLDGVRYATDVFLNHVVRAALPDLTILWYGEPDNSYHVYGIGGSETARALSHTDAEFGRILDWWQSAEERDALQIVVVSDHAHITQKTKVSVAALLGEAGFRVGEHLEDGADLALVSGYSGGILVRDRDAGLATAVGRALMELECCGMVFSAGRNSVEGAVPGSFAIGMVMADHPRAPDLYYILRTDDEPDSHGFVGNCFFDTGLPVGGGIHGGLHASELACTAIAAGSMFRPQARVKSHSGIVDIAPTILHGLGIEAWRDMDGRVLVEALADGASEPPEEIPESFETGAASFTQKLWRTRIGNQVYLDGGKRSDV